MTNVLIVDDSETIRNQVTEALTGAGMIVGQAIDGQDGVSKIRAGGIDCVVCDVNMPNKDGIDLVKEIKAETRFSNLPIIMLTTEGAKDLIAQAKKAGASGWMVKPFKPELVVAAVRKLALK